MPYTPAINSEWERVLAPLIKGVDGSLTSSLDTELPWIDDEQALDPFQTSFDAEVARYIPESVLSRRQPKPATMNLAELTAGLPKTGSRGEQAADRIAVSKGIDVATKGGVGKLLDIAKTQLGTPYVFGTAGPDSFDCSGFTKWAYSRAFGVALPHLSTDQAKVLDKVGRDDLQPGDLVFFSYGRLGSGTIDHVEIYMGNGKMIGTANTTEDLDIDNVDWSHFVQGGRYSKIPDMTPGDAKESLTEALPKTKRVVKRRPVEQHQELAPLALSQGAPAFAAVMDALYAPDSIPYVTTKNMKSKDTSSGPGGSVEDQLRQGFIDAGRPDLARMVGTDEFHDWIQAESGWRTDVVSKYYAGHGRNAGLFQFALLDRDWVWNDVNKQNWTYSASPYQQAQLVARYFGHLTPGKIREYASQVRNGNYHGWG